MTGTRWARGRVGGRVRGPGRGPGRPPPGRAGAVPLPLCLCFCFCILFLFLFVQRICNVSLHNRCMFVATVVLLSALPAHACAFGAGCGRLARGKGGYEPALVILIVQSQFHQPAAGQHSHLALQRFNVGVQAPGHGVDVGQEPVFVHLARKENNARPAPFDGVGEQPDFGIVEHFNIQFYPVTFTVFTHVF